MPEPEGSLSRLQRTLSRNRVLLHASGFEMVKRQTDQAEEVSTTGALAGKQERLHSQGCFANVRIEPVRQEW